jgi:hypothetical protein
MTNASWDSLLLSARRYACAVVLMLGAVVLFALPSGGQTPTTNSNGTQLSRRIPPPRDADQSPLDPVGMGTPIFYEKRLQMLNAAQHKSMVADTDRLLKLVTDLNSQINSNKTSELTAEQLKMVAEIEKLAHSVRDKMRMSVRSAVNIDVNAVPPFSQR